VDEMELGSINPDPNPRPAMTSFSTDPEYEGSWRDVGMEKVEQGNLLVIHFFLFPFSFQLPDTQCVP
jgi:hypothetical protein